MYWECNLAIMSTNVIIIIKLKVVISKALVSPYGLDSVLDGFDEKVFPALPRDVHPSSIIIYDTCV